MSSIRSKRIELVDGAVVGIGAGAYFKTANDSFVVKANDGSTNLFTISNAGAVTLGIEGQNVNIPGTLQIDGSSVTSSQWTDQSSNIHFSTGNVGIGSATPNAKLDVLGDVVFTGGASITGTVSINTSGLSDTSIGNAGNGTVGIAANTVNIAGTVGINASNTLNTTIGNSTGSVTVNGDAVFTGTVSAAQPTDDSHLATKYYVDNYAQGLDIKIVRVATHNEDPAIVPDSYTGGDIDGISLNPGDRVLIKNSGTASKDGIYVYNDGPPTLTRAADFNDEADNIQNCFIYVTEGTENEGTGWICTYNSPLNIGSTAFQFTSSLLEYGIVFSNKTNIANVSKISVLNAKLTYNKNIYELSTLIKVDGVDIANSVTTFEFTLPGKENNFTNATDGGYYELSGCINGLYAENSATVPEGNIENCLIYSVHSTNRCRVSFTSSDTNTDSIFLQIIARYSA